MSLKLNTIIEQLAQIRETIAQAEEDIAPLKQEEEVLRQALMSELKAKDMKSINSEITGEVYSRAERFTFKVADVQKANEYAAQHDALKVDTSKIAKLLRSTDAPMPEDVGFTADITEYISIRSAKSN